MPRLNVIICGSGIAGLAAAIGLARQNHKVILIERSRSLAPIGVGINIPPNSTRVLQAWGLGDKFAPLAEQPEGTAFRRYKDSAIIMQTPAPSKDEGAPA